MGRRLDNGRYGKAYDSKITKEWLLQEYSIKKRSPYQIANDLNVSPKTIYNYIDYYEIPREKRNGEIKSGESFGLLTTIKIVGKSKNGTNIWECECECGGITQVRTSQLKNKTIKSCGCYRKRKNNHKWTGFAGMSGGRLSEIRYRAYKKNMDFDLDCEFLWRLYEEKQNKKCAITNLSIDLNIDASLDRIDSNLGYTKDNVWWVHKDINKMKMDLSLKDFINYCEIIILNKENIKYGHDE